MVCCSLMYYQRNNSLQRFNPEKTNYKDHTHNMNLICQITHSPYEINKYITTMPQWNGKSNFAQSMLFLKAHRAKLRAHHTQKSGQQWEMKCQKNNAIL